MWESQVEMKPYPSKNSYTFMLGVSSCLYALSQLVGTWIFLLPRMWCWFVCWRFHTWVSLYILYKYKT